MSIESRKNLFVESPSSIVFGFGTVQCGRSVLRWWSQKVMAAVTYLTRNIYRVTIKPTQDEDWTMHFTDTFKRCAETSHAEGMRPGRTPPFRFKFRYYYSRS